jgi:pilus assembly protein CpaE
MGRIQARAGETPPRTLYGLAPCIGGVMQRIAIMDPSDSSRDHLRTLLLGMEQVWLEAECARYEFFFDVIRQSALDVAIISLDADSNKAMQLIAQLSAEAPDLALLAVSGKNDGQAILQALRCGAREFLTAPVQLEEMITALQRLGRTRGNGESTPGSNGAPKESLVISVVGSRGGVGCTSIAVNLGASLAQSPGKSIALVDLDLALGDADVALDLIADHTLADIALNIDRLDMTFLRRSLAKHASGLSLLPHPIQMEDAGLIREEHLQRVITLLRASYTHLLLDLSKSFSPTDVTALRMSDVILLVAQLELSSLRNVVRMLLTLSAEEALAERVHVVLNRVGGESEISLKKAEETIGKPIFWQIPNDPKLLADARNQGVPLVTLAPKSKVQQSFAGMARALDGEGKDLAPGEAKSGWGKIFSRSR